MLKPLADFIGHKNFLIVCVLATLLSAGGWMMTILIPPDRLTANDYEEARQLGYFSATAAKGSSIDPEVAFRLGYDIQLESSRWQTRNEVRDAVANCFWISLGLLLLSSWLNPGNTLNIFSSGRDET